MSTATETLTQGSGSGPSSGSGASGGGASGGAANGLPTQAATGWWDSVKDAEVKGWLGNKKFPDAESALKSYWGLERLMGADKAGRTVMLPKDEADEAGWRALASKIGVPETPDGYKLPLPEGVDDGFAKTASKWFHEAGVPPRAANRIAEAWNAWIGEQVQTGEAADRAESEKQMGALEKEWGGEFTAKRELAQRGYRDFAKHFGLDDKAALERAESVLGAANLTKFFAGLGELNGESSFAGPDGKGSFGVTPQEAQRQVDQIIADRTAGKINDTQWRKEYEPQIRKLGEIIARAAV